ncbi:MAG: secondary thiamine-phosphate synthase enzyme YjbQ [Candidatus Zophobacter franzmannii]|nr:secondary thiamine-phosphate synthase enzyme YjbQ [Candidatus Zophobacter franzmannii]
MKISKFNIETKRNKEMQDITYQVQGAVTASEIREGIVTIFIPHTTAGVTINENADPDVMTDLLHSFKIISPDRPEFKHMEGNSDAHLLSTLVGCDCRVFIENGKLLLGTWQSIYFCEFDGPRTRRVILGITGE